MKKQNIKLRGSLDLKETKNTSKRSLRHSTPGHNTPHKLKEFLAEVKKSLQHTNPDYTLVLKNLHLYYDMQIVTFGVNRNTNLVIQFPVFIQPYI